MSLFYSSASFFIVILVFSQNAFTESYSYKTLDSQGENAWTVQESNLEVKTDVSAEDSFARLKVDRKGLSWGEAFKQNPQLKTLANIAVIGDTGCRLKESKLSSTYQDCSDLKQWRFPQVIESLAKENPNLIVHVGDYHYREQCSPGKPCQKMSAVTGYGWEPWKLDFFEPSKKALGEAPWVIVRGNHEDCQRAQLGYHKLLSAVPWKSSCDEFEATQVIELGDIAIVNLDSSAISDMPQFNSEAQNIWKVRVAEVSEKLKTVKAKHIWLFTHKPIYGLVPLGKGYAPLNVNLRQAYEAAEWSKRVEVIFGGHVHNSQLVRVKGGPLQVVIGNGGTALDKSSSPVSAENLAAVNYEKAKLVDHDFGYAMLKGLRSQNPTVEFHDSVGALVFSCHLQDAGKDCF